ncbi:MAG: DUF4382 domain-containing protein [Candidatus Eremiobacteraeota bacterium]|nr:DUF4382 domain-containing protein [Candidatus Eremiobacteraeota bacterium]
MKHYASVFLILLIAIAGCSESTGGADSAFKSFGAKDSLGGIPARQYHMSASDAPPSLGNSVPSEVDLGISRIDAVQNGKIIPLLAYASPKVINFLNYQAQSLDLGTTHLALGTYDALRLVVHIPSSRVVLNGRTLPMSFLYGAPSLSTVNAGRETSTQKGAFGTANILVNIPFSSGATLTNGLHIDFNAAESLTLGSNSSVSVRPTFFIAPEQSSGLVLGKIANLLGLPVSGATVVVTGSLNNVVGTATTDDAGSFQFNAISDGIYTLSIYPTYETAVGQKNMALGLAALGLQAIPGPIITVLPGLSLNVGTLKV